MTSSLCDRIGVPHHRILRDRRDFLVNAGAGFGALALRSMLAQQSAAAGTLAGGGVHHAATAKSVIFLFMEGGPSQLDTFDRKPLLNELAGQPLPSSFKEPITAMGEKNTALLACKRKWDRYGESGLEISDWFPNVAQHADKLAVIRSCYGEGINHAGGCNLMNTSSILGGRPSLGAWTTYGLGTGDADLPAFVVMQDRTTPVVNGVRNWGNGFLPATFQGTPVGSDDPTQPIRNLSTPKQISDIRQREKLDLIAEINRRHASRLPEVSELDARIRSYELAYRMQASAPEAVDLSQETAQTHQLYGMDDDTTRPYGRICLLARRLVERGVRFIQLYSGAGSKWDAHKGIEGNHSKYCREVDRPIAGLLTDLQQRGMLDETLVLWGGEFGRTPMSEQGDGRDHNPTGFTMWMAGGGVQGGQTIGETDELGLYAVRDRAHVHDIHASILHLMGLDNMRLSYNYQGRLERPTVNEGAFIQQLATMG
ncbi:DUF1501 domain-containing protein [Crateriforma conspicua]|uniref:DUF1501 domain-containing protein n=1 Tax=Crateriforma conspicua TaxID=2527996 RepID=UPI00118D52E9|nr:DUF1501 domain-containing protein [Crateriforma conspicua]QDV63451.1 hypothetical protein Mal65_25940 [Crateriforma conspicua]